MTKLDEDAIMKHLTENARREALRDALRKLEDLSASPRGAADVDYVDGFDAAVDLVKARLVELAGPIQLGRCHAQRGVTYRCLLPEGHRPDGPKHIDETGGRWGH